jgi:hypothetical protein
MTEQKEIVFEFGGDGGGITIFRVRSKSGEKFIYHHSEFDPTEEGNDVNFKDQYSGFEQPFQLINNSYPWYKLCVLTVHEDYRQYVMEELVKTLNNESISLENMFWTHRNLEFLLKIKLNYIAETDKKNIHWSYSEADSK